MKFLEELQSICNVWNVPLEFLTISYSDKEGLFGWWIHSSTSAKFKYPEFVMEAIELRKDHCWWIRNSYKSMDWNSAYIHDEDKVDMGVKPFVMKADDFIKHYEALHKSEYNESPESCNAVKVDYARISHLSPKDGVSMKDGNLKDRRVLFIKPPVAFTSLDSIQDPEYPISYKVKGQEFASLKDVDKFVRFDKLKEMLFRELPIQDEVVQRHLISHMVKNQDEIIRLLKGL